MPYVPCMFVCNANCTSSSTILIDVIPLCVTPELHPLPEKHCHTPQSHTLLAAVKALTLTASAPRTESSSFPQKRDLFRFSQVFFLLSLFSLTDDHNAHMLREQYKTGHAQASRVCTVVFVCTHSQATRGCAHYRQRV